jgi:hypothetical protein
VDFETESFENEGKKAYIIVLTDMILRGVTMGYFVTAIVSFIAGMLLAWFLQARKKKTSINSTMIESRLAECSDLTTCNLVYVDLVKYSAGSIPLITKKAFSMIYQANIRAGIDLSLAKVEVTPRTVTIHLPQTQVQSIEVDTETLRFYDEKLAIFNWSNKEDIGSAIAAARKDAEEHANLDNLKNQARTQAEKVLTKLVDPLAGGREVIVA